MHIARRRHGGGSILLAAAALIAAATPVCGATAAPAGPPPPASVAPAAPGAVVLAASGATLTLACPAAPKAGPAECQAADLAEWVAWPAVVALLFAWLALSPGLRADLLRPLRRVNRFKGGPVEIEFNAEAARGVSKSITRDLTEFAEAARSEYERQLRAHDLEPRLYKAKAALQQALGFQSQEVRATVHVPDVVFADHLYQMLDYVPGGQGSGRRWSCRYGILGRAWRLGGSLVSNNALGTTPGSPVQDEPTVLIQEWGMSRDEATVATSGGARKSFLCIVLKVKGRPVGILYLDALYPDQFKVAVTTVSNAPALNVDPRLEGLDAIQDLAQALDEAMKPLREGGTYLRLSGPAR